MSDSDPRPEENTFGSQLRSLRTGKKLTLKEVEAITGISNAYLSQVENGKIAKPSPDRLYALAELYQTSYDKMMYAAGYLGRDPAEEAVPNAPKTLIGAALSSKNLTPEEEETLVEYLNFIRRKR